MTILVMALEIRRKVRIENGWVSSSVSVFVFASGSALGAVLVGETKVKGNREKRPEAKELLGSVEAVSS